MKVKPNKSLSVSGLFKSRNVSVQDRCIETTNFLNTSTLQDSRDIFYPRASNLYKECMRMTVLGYMGKKRVTNYVSMKQRITYGKGNAYHWWAQNTPDLFGDNRIGYWKCYACGKLRYFGKPPKKPCHYCGASNEATFYHEHIMVSSGEYLLTGHPDLFLQQHGKIYVAELKSIQYADFEKLKDALIDHKWQVLSYMLGLSYDRNLPVKVNDKSGFVVYISKAEAKKAFPVKIFEVQPDAYIMDQIYARLTLFKEGILDYPNNIPVVNTKCPSSGWGSYQAKTCPVINECISYYKKGEKNGE